MKAMSMKVIALAMLGLAACGSVTADGQKPSGTMSMADCASYCGCATPRATVAGRGLCVCVAPPDGGATGSPSSCECGGWAQASAADGGLSTEAVLWSAEPACSSFSGG